MSDSSKGSEFGWKVFAGLAALVAAIVARKVLETGWVKLTGKNPPDNPESPETTWAEALGWAALSGTAVALARLVATRKAAATWHRSTGSLPPGMGVGETS